MSSQASRSKGEESFPEPQELKNLKAKYASQLATLKELFPEWSDDDLLFAIEDANGDLELAVDRISEGKRLLDTAEYDASLFVWREQATSFNGVK